MAETIREIKKEEIRPGMYIKLFQKTKEGDKEKLQHFEGLVIARKHGKEAGATITLRRIIEGVGVEWILPLSSPKIEKINLVKESRVKRAKLYYLRNKSQRKTRAKLRKEIRSEAGVVNETVKTEKEEDAEKIQQK